MKNKSNQRTAEVKKEKLLSLLQKHGLNIYDNLDQGKFPQFVIPSRSVSNIVYDKKLRQYILGSANAVRSSRNMSQLRSYTQLTWLAFFVNRLVR
ncbi:MAG: DNA topoisomerase IV subunit A, partial [Nitrosotalea sp.]